MAAADEQSLILYKCLNSKSRLLIATPRSWHENNQYLQQTALSHLLVLVMLVIMSFWCFLSYEVVMLVIIWLIKKPSIDGRHLCLSRQEKSTLLFANQCTGNIRSKLLANLLLTYLTYLIHTVTRLTKHGCLSREIRYACGTFDTALTNLQHVFKEDTAIVWDQARLLWKRCVHKTKFQAVHKSLIDFTQAEPSSLHKLSLFRL